MSIVDTSGITWRGGPINDEALLRDLPPDLAELLHTTNGFILHEGALHIRGVCLAPEWHSLREAWRGTNALYMLYDNVLETDIPFAQDQLGDQFLLRNGEVLRLLAESDEVESLAKSLEDFFALVKDDVEGFLNVGLDHKLQPGQLLQAFPPFVVQGSAEASLKALPTVEVILFHADLARQIRDIPNGGKIEFKLMD